MTRPRPPLYSERLGDALQRAARWHQTQARKGTTIPYISHPLRVCAIVLEDGGSEDEACAALLHDAVEDTDATLDDVRDRFGPEVARIVAMCTDDDGDAEVKPPWFTRKAMHFVHLRDDPGFDTMAARVVAADKLANLSAQLDDHAALGPTSWQRFKGGIAGTLWFVEMATVLVAHQLVDTSRLPAHLVAGVARLQAIRDEMHATLDGLDVRIAELLSSAESPSLPG